MDGQLLFRARLVGAALVCGILLAVISALPSSNVAPATSRVGVVDLSPAGLRGAVGAAASGADLTGAESGCSCGCTVAAPIVVTPSSCPVAASPPPPPPVPEPSSCPVAPPSSVVVAATPRTPPLRPRAGCANVFVLNTDAGGVGHRVWALTMGVALAQRAGAALAIDEENFLDVPRWNRPTTELYPFLPELLQLPAFLTVRQLSRLQGTTPRGTTFSTPWGDLRFVDVPSVEDSMAAAAAGCGQILPVGTGGMYCRGPAGEQAWCFIAGAFNEARPLMSSLFAQSSYATRPLTLYDADGGSSARGGGAASPIVAWHVRNDDIKLHANDVAYWTALASAVVAHVGSAARHHLFCELPVPADGPFGFLLRLPGVAFHVHAGTPVDVALFHLARAAVLVHSGSSFSLTAGLLAPPRELVQLAPLPKEGIVAAATYAMDGTVAIEADGSLTPDASRLFNERLRVWREGK